MSETLDDVPFDLQALRILLYDKDDSSWGLKLRKSIMAALDEIMAEPVKAVPSMFRKKVKSQAPEESELAARVGAIERQLASIEASAESGNTKPSRLAIDDVLAWQIERATSERNAEDAILRAASRGLPLEIVIGILERSSMPTRGVRALTDYAKNVCRR